MTSVLPGITDRYRNLKGGRRRYVGQILLFDPEPRVIAEVYGETLEAMRVRKHAVAAALKELELTEPAP